MTKFRRMLVPACLFFTLILFLAPSVTFSAEKEYPDGVTAAKEATVEVMSWVDGWISDGWYLFEAKGPVSLGSGFFANENGDVLTAAHCVNMSEEELTEAAIMYYIGGVWFEEGWYERVDFGSFYNYYYSTVWWAWVRGELTVNAEEVDYVYRYGEGEPHRVKDILFYEEPESGTDIAILETGLSGTPYLGLQQATPPEGSRAYVIGYAGIDLTLEFWQAMDEIMADPSQRPDTFSELMTKAAGAMVEGLKSEGPSIETGLLGSSTRIYEMDARRFHGTAWGGLSGGPVIDELGNCLGMLPWGYQGGRGYFIPAQHLNEASQQAGVDTFPALSIGPVTVEPFFLGEGQSFEVSAEVTNLGFGSGDYTATLNLSDGTQASQALSVAAGTTETLVLSAVKSAPGLSMGLLEIGRASAELTVNPFALSNLTVKPLTAEPDENIRVQVEAANLSGETVTASLDLSVDGVVEATRSLTLAGGAGETVTFLVSRDVETTYEVTVANLSQTFTVEQPLPLTLIGVGVAGLLGLVGLIIGIIALVRLRG
jgi:hypothetical protein